MKYRYAIAVATALLSAGSSTTQAADRFTVIPPEGLSPEP